MDRHVSIVRTVCKLKMESMEASAYLQDVPKLSFFVIIIVSSAT